MLKKEELLFLDQARFRFVEGFKKGVSSYRWHCYVMYEEKEMIRFEILSMNEPTSQPFRWAVLNFEHMNKPEHRMNKQDVGVAIAASHACVQIQEALQKSSKLDSIKLEGYVRSFLKPRPFVYTREMIKAIKQAKRLTIG